MKEFQIRPRISFNYYKIAEHSICIIDRIGIDLDQALPSFIPFKTQEPKLGPNLLSIDITDSQCNLKGLKLSLLSDISVVWQQRFRFEESTDSYFTSIQADKSENVWIMKSSKDFAFSRIHLKLDEIYMTTKLSWLIMVSFSQACLNSRTVIIHASVVIKENMGFAFLGKSGTGKSTHSNLWLSHIEGTELLNDDSPAVRVFQNGEIYIYGTPWSGKTICYHNRKAKLFSITRLEQSPNLRFNWLKGGQALLSIFPSANALRWDHILYPQMLSIMEYIVNNIPIAHFKCTPKGDSAILHNLKLLDGKVD
ncbi:hypothetical protein [Sphingobacterium cellulitidis]|uniref:hypothetical protein n=1 Tax=Sphingobacterium cellulitidis TaxID=1768011 RepID=UPI003C7AB4CE